MLLLLDNVPRRWMGSRGRPRNEERWRQSSVGRCAGPVFVRVAVGGWGVGGTLNPGAAPFDGYGIVTDLWSYATASELSIGMVFGSGGQALDNLGLGGRIYSAQMTFDVIPAPGALAAIGVCAIGARRRR